MFGGDVLLSAFLLINVFVVGAVTSVAIMQARAHAKSKKSSAPTQMPLLPLDSRQRITDEAEQRYQKILQKNTAELERSLATTTQRLAADLDKLGDGMLNDELQLYQRSLADLREGTTKSIASAQEMLAKHQADMRERFTARQEEMDSKLREYEAELQAKLAARNSEIEQEFQRKQAEYAQKQAQTEAELAQHQAELEAALKQRETVLAQHQADLNAEFLERQKQHAAHLADMENALNQEMEARRHTLGSQLDAKLGDVIAAFLTETLRHNVDLGAQLPYLTAQLEEHKDELRQEIAK
ncbi:MAG: hypothetical protein WAQ25_03845 [Candidatus Saccharimonas sp.]